MSRHNKVNPDHYKVAGRLSTDDLARERRNQSSSRLMDLRERSTKPMPPWMTRHDEPRSDEQSEPTPAPVEPPARSRPASTRPKARSSRKPVARTAAATKATVKPKPKAQTKTKAKAKAKAKTATTATRKSAKKRPVPSRRG